MNLWRPLPRAMFVKCRFIDICVIVVWPRLACFCTLATYFRLRISSDVSILYPSHPGFLRIPGNIQTPGILHISEFYASVPFRSVHSPIPIHPSIRSFFRLPFFCPPFFCPPFFVLSVFRLVCLLPCCFFVSPAGCCRWCC